MQKVLRAAALAAIGLTLGGCGIIFPHFQSIPFNPRTPEQELRDAAASQPRPRRVSELGDPVRRRATAVPRKVASSPPDPLDSPPQTRDEPAATGTVEQSTNPPADGPAVNQRRTSQIAQDNKRIAERDQAANRVLRSICQGC